MDVRAQDACDGFIMHFALLPFFRRVKRGQRQNPRGADLAAHRSAYTAPAYAVALGFLK